MKTTQFKLFIFLFAMTQAGAASAQTVLPLYPKAVPNSRPVADQEWQEINKDSVLIVHQITRPTITVYLPKKEKATGTAVIIYPGGGYGIVAAGHEGAEVAQALAQKGIAAFVVKYRLPDSAAMVDKEIGPLQDAQRAIQLVRQNAKKWGLDPHRIGILGFSAGGHLAATAGTHFGRAYISNPQHTSLRPDFMVLAYPVISFTDSIGHIGSRDNLLGKHPSEEKIKEYSAELQVTAQTPPTFLVHAKDDGAVKVQNTLLFARALEQHHVPVQVFLYEKGGHGFGLHNKTDSTPWLDMAVQWIGELAKGGKQNGKSSTQP